MEIRNHRLDLAYIGTRYHGWQEQPGRETIQGLLNELLTKLYRARVCLAGSGRTDAGTHARGQVASFRAEPLLPVDRLPIILNTGLPEDIRVLGARLVPDSFHAQRSATSKIYLYRIHVGPVIDPFDLPFHHRLSRWPDLDAMAGGARHFLGTHDFTTFCAHASDEDNHVRTVLDFRLRRRGAKILVQVEATGFLHHMVRNMVGTLLEVGKGRRPAGEIQALLAARDRRLAGPTAPARGLCLMKVFYGARRKPSLQSPPA